MSRSKSYNETIVLEKAMHVFWKYGYEATSVRMLEKEMGINQFSIYSSFKSKKNLFISSIRNYRKYVEEYVYCDLLKENAGLAEFENFLYSSYLSAKTNSKKIGCLVVNTSAELGNKDGDIAYELHLYYDFICDMLKRLLRNAIAKREIPFNTDIEQQSNFFLGVMQSISIFTKTMNNNKLTDFISIALSQVK